MCRRICVLRERGEHTAAQELRGSILAETVAAIRTIGVDTDSAVTLRVEQLFAAESERVANAAVLAELLGPMLRSDGIGSSAFDGSTAAAGRDRGNLPEKQSATLRSSAPAAAGAPPDIADFIDEMLALERPQPPAAPKRRAS